MSFSFFSIDTWTSFLNPIMHPLVNIHPFFAIAIVSFLIALFNAWIYKTFTDQHKMRALKEDMKRMQTEVRKYKDNATKMMEIQSKLMQKNMEYMKSSFKPTLITLIPILIILGWMTGHLAYDPLHPNTPVNVTLYLQKNQVGAVDLHVPTNMTVLNGVSQDIDQKSHSASWLVEGSPGHYTMTYAKGDANVTQDIIFSNEQEYAKPIVNFGTDVFSSGHIDTKSKTVFTLWFIPFNYLVTYLLCAVLFSLGIRKLMKLH